MVKGVSRISNFPRQLGEGGCNMGSSCWEMYCVEHNIRPDGICCNITEMPWSFFKETGGNKAVPRALFVDLEPTAINEIRTGKFRSFFNPHYLMAGKEDTANCFAKGYLSLGNEIAGPVMDRIRQVAGDCHGLQGFLIFRSFGGGTGSGLTANLLSHLDEEYPKTSIMEFSLYPATKYSSIVVEPYNACFATHLSLEHTQGCFIIDNEACFDICDHYLDVCTPNFFNINRLIGNSVSAMTASLRFGGEVNVDLKEIQTNLMPYPRIQYPIISYAPLISAKHASFQTATVNSLVESCFEPSNQFLKCDTRKGKYIACTILFRGDVATSSVNAAINTVKSKKTGNFVSWCPTGIKIGINYRPPGYIPEGDLMPTSRSALMLSNSTAVRTAWERVAYKFDLMFKRRAYLHWYTNEGLEEADFHETRLDLEALSTDYKEAELE